MEGNLENPSGRVSRLFTALCVLYVTCLLLSNLIAGKLIVFGGFVLQAADLLFPLTYVLADVFTEVYGFRNSRFVIWLGFLCNFFAVGICLLAVGLPHPGFWTGQEAYETVFAMTPRIFGASLLAYLIGEFSNSVVLSKMKVAMSGRRLWVRTVVSSIVGEGLDTVIFTTLAFAGLVRTDVLVQMIALQYCWKLAYEVILTPVTYRVVGWLKAKERLDIYDRDIRYTIF